MCDPGFVASLQTSCPLLRLPYVSVLRSHMCGIAGPSLHHIPSFPALLSVQKRYT